jgi:three-Cys-motif partner protein
VGEMPAKRFFEKHEPQSIVKSKIVSKYFVAWSDIMLARSRPGTLISYADLFCGPGRFEDGSPSTPLLLLEYAIATPKLYDRLTTVFNDSDPNSIEQLEKEIASLTGISRLKHLPRLSVSEVGSDMAAMLGKLKLVPTLFFLDPFGYKGLSLDLFGNIIRNWGCECIFFFNYNRVGPAVSNSIVDSLINELFGVERANRLRQQVRYSPGERQSIVIDALTDALAEVDGHFVLPFEFESAKGKRPSHYVIFVTKSFRGYDIMKEIMAGLSSDEGAVKELKYVPMKSPQMDFLEELSLKHSIHSLKDLVAAACAGQTMTVEHVYMATTVGTPYTSKNVKDALRLLEEQKLVFIEPPAAKRMMRNGVRTLADTCIVSFPN